MEGGGESGEKKKENRAARALFLQEQVMRV